MAALTLASELEGAQESAEAAAAELREQLAAASQQQERLQQRCEELEAEVSG